MDVDGLDPGVFPSTGTPQPGGLSWQQTLEVIRAVAAESAVPADRRRRGGTGGLAASTRLRPFGRPAGRQGAGLVGGGQEQVREKTEG